MVMLISGGRYLSLSIVSATTLVFICWLSIYASDNRIAKTIWRGRNYSTNPIKLSLLYFITITAVGLQPEEYTFAFELHFEIFIISTTCLLLFGFFYLQRLVLTFASRDKNYRSLFWQSCFELLFLVFLWLYFLFMGEHGLSCQEQLDYILSNWWNIPLLGTLCAGYELSLSEHIRKVSLSQLAITLATGFLWFNVYQMAVEAIDLRLYISVFIMTAVLLTNIGLISEHNFKKIQKLLSLKKTRRSKKDRQGRD
jgi:hypothetical protein